MLQIVHRNNQVTRTVLTERMGLTRGAIGDLLAELNQHGLVALGGPEERGSVGRPSPVVRASAGKVRILVASVDSDQIEAGLFSLGGVLISKKSQPTPLGFDPVDITDTIVDLLVGLNEDLVRDNGWLLGIGVGIPGMVGLDQVVRMAPNLFWHNVPILELLQARLPPSIPIMVANDADLGALSEHRRGAGIGSDFMVYVGCNDVGVGGGVILDGKPLRGVDGYAGELGHLFVNPAGERCHCGSHGCWEMEIGSERVARALGLRNSNPAVIAEALATLDVLPPGLHEVGRFLAFGIASLVNVLNVDRVVLGGTLRDLYPVVKTVTDQTLSTTAVPAALERLVVTCSSTGEDAVLIGAAEMVTELLFVDPVERARKLFRGSLAQVVG